VVDPSVTSVVGVVDVTVEVLNIVLDTVEVVSVLVTEGEVSSSLVVVELSFVASSKIL